MYRQLFETLRIKDISVTSPLVQLVEIIYVTKYINTLKISRIGRLKALDQGPGA